MSNPAFFDIEFIVKKWIDLRRRYAMSMRMSIREALDELEKDYDRWREISHEACLARYRSRRVKAIVEEIMTIADQFNN